MTALMPSAAPALPEFQCFADNRVKKAFRLAGTRARRHQGVLAGHDRADCRLLMTVNMFVVRDVGQQRMQHALVGQFAHAGSPAEAAREAHKWSGEQRGAPRLVQVQELPHLPMQTRIGERIRSQLVAEKIFDDVLRVRDRIEHSGHVDLTFSGLRVHGTAEKISLDRITE